MMADYLSLHNWYKNKDYDTLQHWLPKPNKKIQPDNFYSEILGATVT